MSDRSKGRDQTKSDHRPSRLGVGHWANNLKTQQPLGLRPHPTINFLHSSEDNEMLSQLPKANICANILHLFQLFIKHILILKGT